MRRELRARLKRIMCDALGVTHLRGTKLWLHDVLWALAPPQKQTQKRMHGRVTNLEKGPLLQIPETYFWEQMAASTFDKWDPRLSRPPGRVRTFVRTFLKVLEISPNVGNTHTQNR